ncbi:MAG: molybdopterin-binding protein [Coleofasciculaceae cyanobacterium]
MPRKQQGWITFQSSPEEREILEQYCQQTQRTKTEILRELVRTLKQKSQLPSKASVQPQQESVANSEIELFYNSEYQSIRVSARNVLKGKIKQVVTDSVNTLVTLEVAPGVELSSVITRASAEELGLLEGKEAYAVIKSNNVMIAAAKSEDVSLVN